MSSKLSEFLATDEPVLGAYKREVINVLYLELLEAAKPLVREAAEQAAKHLEAKLLSYVDMAKNETVFRLNVQIDGFPRSSDER